MQLKSPLTLLCNPDFCQRIQSQLRGTGEQVTSRRFGARDWDGQMSEMTSHHEETERLSSSSYFKKARMNVYLCIDVPLK